MPARLPTLPWTYLVRVYPAADAAMLVEAMKTSTISKSQLQTCTVCNVATPHKMCKESASGGSCRWRCKTLECQELHVTTVAELGSHLTPRRGAEPAKLTGAMTPRTSLLKV
jgi:hypothetical protein